MNVWGLSDQYEALILPELDLDAAACFVATWDYNPTSTMPSING
jgi:hypothetical protein